MDPQLLAEVDDAAYQRLSEQVQLEEWRRSALTGADNDLIEFDDPRAARRSSP